MQGRSDSCQIEMERKRERTETSKCQDFKVWANFVISFIQLSWSFKAYARCANPGRTLRKKEQQQRMAD